MYDNLVLKIMIKEPKFFTVGPTENARLQTSIHDLE